MKIAIAIGSFLIAFVAGFACNRPAITREQAYPTSKDIGVIVIQPGCMRYPAPTSPDADFENELLRPRRLDNL